MLRLKRASFGLLAGFFLLPAATSAQTLDGATRIGGLIGRSLTTRDDGSAIALNASHRFRSHLWFGADASYEPHLTLGTFSVCTEVCALLGTGLASPTVIGGTLALEGRAIALAATFMADVPLGPRWLRPYVMAGAGAASIRRDLRNLYYGSSARDTSTHPIASVGGGADVLLGRRFSIGVDVRYQRAFADENFGREHFYRDNIPGTAGWTRVGSSIGYRF